MQLTNDQKKMDIVSRLVKEGEIDFNEAIELLRLEETIKLMPQPFEPRSPYQPFLGSDPYRGKILDDLIKQKERRNPFEVTFNN